MNESEAIVDALREVGDIALRNCEALVALRQLLAQIAKSPAVLQEISRSVRAMANTNDPRSTERGLQMLDSMIRRQHDQSVSEARNAAS